MYVVLARLLIVLLMQQFCTTSGQEAECIDISNFQVECNTTTISELVQNISSETQQLSFQLKSMNHDNVANTEVHSLTNGLFSHLTDLLSLVIEPANPHHFADHEIRLESNAFVGLKHLKYLRLSISISAAYFPSTTFATLPSLHVLDLTRTRWLNQYALTNALHFKSRIR